MASATRAATVISVVSSGDVDWVDTANAVDGNTLTYAETDSRLTVGDFAYPLRFKTFGFSSGDFPSDADIVGIEFSVLCARDDPAVNVSATNVYLNKPSDVLGTDDHGNGTNLPHTTLVLNYIGTATFGGAADAWSEALTAANIWDADFGLYWQVAHGSGFGSVYARVAEVYCTIYYGLATAAVTPQLLPDIQRPPERTVVCYS